MRSADGILGSVQSADGILGGVRSADGILGGVGQLWCLGYVFSRTQILLSKISK